MQPTQNLNIIEEIPLIPPQELKEALPCSEKSNEVVASARETVRRILAREDHRMLAIVGPCSIHDRKAAMDYAHRLSLLSTELAEQLFVIMRVYFEKPRTTVGWKGLINDPHLDGSFDISEGLKMARSILMDVTELGLATATEVLDPITPQYIDDLVVWASIGARTTESQTHRQMASGLSMPVGFKNATDGNLQIALDAMSSARSPHYFLGIDEKGQTCIVNTRGNLYGHLILRGGRSGTNYSEQDVAKAMEMLDKVSLPKNILIDCSHANSNKDYSKQPEVLKSVIQQRAAGNDNLIGFMLESNLHPGAQSITKSPSDLSYGVSITDGCLGWDETESILREAAQNVDDSMLVNS